MRVTLSGYYGYGNAGDEAVLSGLVQSLRAVRPDVDITVLSGSPDETRRTHSVNAVYRYRPKDLISALRGTDLLLSGGGSLLQDTTSAHGILYYLGVVRLAQMLGKKTMFAAQGIGPLRLPRSRRLTAAIANRCNALTVRDPQSAELLTRIGVRRPVEVTADPALLLSPSQSIALRPDTFAVALRSWPGHQALPTVVADACRSALPEGRALLVAMQPGADTDAGEQFAHSWPPTQTLRPPPGADWSALLHSLGSCGLVVGMRLHALILAAACGVPSVALAYDPKVAAFMAQSGQSDAVWNMAADNADALSGLLAGAWAGRAARASALRGALPGLQARARRTAEIAVSLLE